MILWPGVNIKCQLEVALKKMAPSVFLQLSYKFLINRDHNENADTTFVMASGAVATVCYLFLGEEKKIHIAPVNYYCTHSTISFPFV